MSKQANRGRIEAGKLIDTLEKYIMRNAKAACASLTLGNAELERQICRVVALASRNPETRADFVANPAETLAGFGVEMPAGVNIQVHESIGNTFHISLPPLITRETVKKTLGEDGIEIDESELESNSEGSDLLFNDDFDVGDMTGVYGWDSDKSDADSRD